MAAIPWTTVDTKAGAEMTKLVSALVSEIVRLSAIVASIVAECTLPLKKWVECAGFRGPIPAGVDMQPAGNTIEESAYNARELSGFVQLTSLVLIFMRYAKGDLHALRDVLKKPEFPPEQNRPRILVPSCDYVTIQARIQTSVVSQLKDAGFPVLDSPESATDDYRQIFAEGRLLQDLHWATSLATAQQNAHVC